ncbi:hypothetical protein QNO07_16570 [Streptomyces sp. 549]|uniref:hypothetical protein n=1 Tax=Streptomyces sp. 549 TaxID=3049076 RepID=UPI0024C433C1|nr:hypothetical protein [Streptomyces sp. 549]MDK1475012.1 hypothetical protein [Streptomyces sp. 549]
MQDWDDDSDYRSAVGCAWLSVVFAVTCIVIVVGATIVVLLSLWGMPGMLSLISD